MAANTTPQEAISRHNEMVFEISNILAPDIGNEWKKLLALFSEDPLTRVEISNINIIQDLFGALMNKMSIGYGNYNFFIRKARLVNQRVVKIVEESTTDIRALMGTDCGDDETLGPSCPKNQRVQESPDYHHERRAMIKTTKTTIDRCTKEQFVLTKAFEDAKTKLLHRNIVIIKGNSGDGKTRTAQELIAWMWKGYKWASDMEIQRYKKQPIQFHNLINWDEIVEADMNLCIFIDDLSVDLFNEIENRQESIKSLISGETNGESNYLVITVRNDIFKRMSTNRIFVEENLIDTSSARYHITEERHQILDLYLPKDVKFSNTEKYSIVECAPNIGFPQCCRLYKDFPGLQKQGVRFFKNPYHVMKIALTKLEYGRCAALLYLFLCNGRVMEEDLDPSSDRIDKTVVEKAFEVDLGEVKVGSELSYEEKVQLIQQSLECLSGSLVTNQEWFWYTFTHDSVKDTVALLYQEATPIGFVQNCPCSYLFSIQSENTTYQLWRDSIDMYKRVLKELKCKDMFKHKDIALSDIWNDSQFRDGFFRWLDKKEIDNTDFHLKWTTEDYFHGFCYYNQSEKYSSSFLVHVANTNNLNLLYILLERTPKEHPQLQCALFGLVRAGHTDVLGEIIETGVTPTLKVSYKDSPSYCHKGINLLHEAILFERVEMVEMLATKYKFLLQEICDDNLSPLHAAVQTGNRSLYDIMDTFVFGDLGRDERVKRLSKMVDERGRTVLHFSCDLYWRNKNRMILHLLDKYPSLVQATAGCKPPILHSAVDTGDCSLYDKIETLLFGDLGRDERVKRLSEMVDDEGRTVLHYSCRFYCGDKAMVLHLLHKYPELASIRDKNGYHCLHYIALGSDEDSNSVITTDHIDECSSKDLFVDVDSYLRTYYKEKGINYDITTIVTNEGETVLDIAKKILKNGNSKQDMCNYLSQLWL